MVALQSVPAAGGKRAPIVQDILVGVILFVSCSYILVLNPAILGTAGFPAPNVFTATALAAGFGSIFMGLLSRSPSVVAPGMGLNGFIAGFCALSVLPWQGVAVLMLCVCLFHWVFFVIPGNRKRFLEAIPPHTMDIITSSVGGMILRDAFVVGNLIDDKANPLQFISSFSPVLKWPMSGQVLLFILMTVVVLGCYAALRHQAERLADEGRFGISGIFDLLAGLALLASVPVSALIARYWLEAGLPSMQIQEHASIAIIPFSEGFQQIAAAAGGPLILGVIPFVLTALFVLLVDAPGTPYLLLKEKLSTPPTPEETARAKLYPKRVQLGFHVEAIAGLVCVFFQGSPAVCYAESNFAKELRVVRGTPAFICGVLFLLVLFLAWNWPGEVRNLAARLPLISLSPLLATIAAIITLAGFSEPREGGRLTILDQVQRFTPRFFAVGGAFLGQLSVGIAAGILFEWAVSTLRGKDRDSQFGVFEVLALLSLVSLVTIIVLIVAQSHRVSP